MRILRMCTNLILWAISVEIVFRPGGMPSMSSSRKKPIGSSAKKGSRK